MAARASSDLGRGPPRRAAGRGRAGAAGGGARPGRTGATSTGTARRQSIVSVTSTRPSGHGPEGDGAVPPLERAVAQREPQLAVGSLDGAALLDEVATGVRHTSASSAPTRCRFTTSDTGSLRLQDLVGRRGCRRRGSDHPVGGALSCARGPHHRAPQRAPVRHRADLGGQELGPQADGGDDPGRGPLRPPQRPAHLRRRVDGRPAALDGDDRHRGRRARPGHRAPLRPGAGGPLRAGRADARVDRGDGPAGRPLRAGAGRPPGRRRLRSPAHRHAHPGARAAGRHLRDVPRLRRGQRRPPPRHPDPPGVPQRRGHRERPHGGRAGQGHHRDRQRGPRARDRRPGQLPQPHGRQGHRRRAARPSWWRASRTSTRWSTP